jgi:hypothetical protein
MQAVAQPAVKQVCNIYIPIEKMIKKMGQVVKTTLLILIRTL